MAATARRFEKTFIETKPDVEKRRYIEQFVSAALSAAPNRIYNAEFEISQGEFFPTPQYFVEQFLTDSERAADILRVLGPAGDAQPTKFQDLPPDVRRGYEAYPLVDGEGVLSVNIMRLIDDWEGLRQGMVFVERETNRSRAYFAVPGLRADPWTPGVTPAFLLRQVPPAAVTTTNPAAPLNISEDGPDAALEAQQRELGLKIFRSVLDAIATLSWATPAGPFVAAGAAIVEVIVEAIFGGKDNLLSDIQTIADGVVNRIEFVLNSKELVDSLNNLQTFNLWANRIMSDDIGQTDATFRQALTKPGGIIYQLENETGPFRGSLFYVLTSLQTNSDLAPGKPYTSPYQWSIASAKLRLLLLVVAIYISTLKMKLIFMARLYESGYNFKGDPLSLEEQRAGNPDNTFMTLTNEMKRFQQALPPLIENVRSRRMGMIEQGESSWCEVAYSNLTWEKSRRAMFWKPPRSAGRDGLFTGERWDQFVRAKDDNPSTKEFGQPDKSIIDPITGAIGFVKGGINYHYWHRLEVRDKAVYDGKNPQEWAVSDCGTGSYTFYHNKNFPRLKQEYIDDILREFDTCAKIPASLSKGADDLLVKWTPQMPKDFEGDIVGILSVDNWSGDAKPGELWSDKTVSVAYSFALRTVAGKESQKSKPSPMLAPKGPRPHIVGLPKKGEYLKYITQVCVYRRFQKEMRQGPPKLGPDRLVAILSRVQGREGFVGELFDDETTQHDKEELAKL
jgi:hypothetical protein